MLVDNVPAVIMIPWWVVSTGTMTDGGILCCNSGSSVMMVMLTEVTVCWRSKVLEL